MAEANLAQLVAESRVRIRPGWYGAFVLLSALVHLPELLTSKPVDDDEAYLAIMGRMLRHGDRLYTGVIDRKPPLALWAYQMLVPDNWSLRWVHLVAIGLIAVNGIIVMQIACRLSANPNIGLIAGSLAICGSALLGHADAHAANFEVWGMAPASLAVLLVIAHPTSLRHALAAGIAVGVATNCKQPYVFTIIAVIAFATLGSGGPASAHPIRAKRYATTVLAIAGLSATTVGVATVAGWSGYWRWVWLENGDYVRVGLLTIIVVGLRQLLIFIALQWPLVGASFAPLLMHRTSGARPRRVGTVTSRSNRVGLAIWIVVAMVGVASGLRFFGHYFQQLVPPVAVVAALGAASLRRPSRAVGAATAWAFALFSLVAFPALRGLEPVPNDFAHKVQQRTAHTDRVLVWGRLPDAAVAAQRLPAGRFVHHAYLTGLWASGEAVSPAIMATEPYLTRWRAYLGDLASDPPALIIDAAPTVKGWHAFAARNTPLRDLIDRCYSPAAPIDRMAVFALRTGPGACTHDRRSTTT